MDINTGEGLQFKDQVIKIRPTSKDSRCFVLLRHSDYIKIYDVAKRQTEGRVTIPGKEKISNTTILDFDSSD